MKHKSIVFIIALSSFFFSHCTNVGSYYGPSVHSLDASIVQDDIHKIEMQLIDMNFKINNNQECICKLIKELKKEVTLDIMNINCFGCY